MPITAAAAREAEFLDLLKQVAEADRERVIEALRAAAPEPLAIAA